MTLFSLGWDDFFANAFRPHLDAGLTPARITLQHKHVCLAQSEFGELQAACTGRLLFDASDRAALPAVGDWTAVRLRSDSVPDGEPRPADIHAVLPRRTSFSRASAGDTGSEQVLAANVDTVFLVTGLDRDYSVRRIERYLAAARSSGAQPVIVLNKADLLSDRRATEDEVRAVARSTPVVTLSATHDTDLAPLSPWLLPGATVALLGSSGVGKSTLVNRLLGAERQPTREVSAAVPKGRHTTTRRELIALPSGALVVDTPGLRELQFWDVGDAAVEHTFDDIAALAVRCRFHNCTHEAEPGCAVRAALEAGALDPARWQSFVKLRREQAYAARRADPRLARESRDAWKKIHKAHRARCRFEEEN